MPNDPQLAQRRDLEMFSTLLGTFEACADKVAAAVQELLAAHSPLVDQLTRLYPGNSSRPIGAAAGEAPLMTRLSEELATCTARLAAGTPHVQALKALLRDIQEKVAGATLAFELRDEAFQKKAHYDSKLEKLKSNPARAGPGFTMEERVLRNKQKQKDSQQEFDKHFATAGKATQAVLAARWPQTCKGLAELLRCHAAIFGGEQLTPLANRFAEVPWVPGASSSEARPAAAAAAPSGGLEPQLEASHEESSGDEVPQAPSSQGYHKGDRVQVWSASEERWRDGVVEEVFTEACTASGYQVPAGCVKISASTWVKFVRAEQLPATVRRAPVLPVLYAKGDRVEVLNSSTATWEEAVVEAVLETPETADGVTLSPGSIKVATAGGVQCLTAAQAVAELRHVQR